MLLFSPNGVTFTLKSYTRIVIPISEPCSLYHQSIFKRYSKTPFENILQSLFLINRLMLPTYLFDFASSPLPRKLRSRADSISEMSRVKFLVPSQAPIEYQTSTYRELCNETKMITITWVVGRSEAPLRAAKLSSRKSEVS